MSEGRKGRVLVVDDEAALCRAYAQHLEAHDFTVDQAAEGADALRLVDANRYDVIVSDIAMPGMSGIELLRGVRQRDLDVPVILVTGYPTVDTAAQAVEYGALRYLIKPVEQPILVESVERAVKLQHIARLKRQAAEYLGNDEKLIGDNAGLETSMRGALDSLWVAYQPIVNCVDQSVVAYEALVRTRESTLPNPRALFSAAERLGRVREVGRAIHASIARTLAAWPGHADIFVNLHQADLLDASLFAPDSPLTPFAERVVLEITERVALEQAGEVAAQIRRLRELGYRVAIDDLGAGYAGLSCFTLLTPDVVKLDITLVRNIHQDAVKQKVVGSLTTLCRELGMRVVAEGIETPAERDVVMAFDGDLLQGYLFAKPGLAFPEVSW